MKRVQLTIYCTDSIIPELNGTFFDLQRRQVREEVSTNKETHEHPVINGSLQGGAERGVGQYYFEL